MKNFFVIGFTDPSFRWSHKIADLPQFQGIIMLDDEPVFNRYVPPDLLQSMLAYKRVSLGYFLNYTKKNPDTVLVSFFDFSAGHRFLKKLQDTKRYKFEVQDCYNFYLENNIPVLYVPSVDERDMILNEKKEWANFRRQLTDDYSQFSFDCYLTALESKDRRKLIPTYIDMDYKIFNRLSRKLGLVPNSSEIYVDVGAWDGDTVTHFVNCAGDYRAIHAFEPSAKPFTVLQNRKPYLNNFYAHQAAVSSTSGTIEFFVNSSMAARAADLNTPTDAPVVKVPCVTLDDNVDEATVIKIEVEGHEVSVIEGARNLIKKCKPDLCVYAYHFPLDPLRILEAVNKIHVYKHIAIRFYSVDMHFFFLYFSDRMPFV